MVAYDLDTANVHDTRFHPLIAAYAPEADAAYAPEADAAYAPEADAADPTIDPMLILGDSGFHAKTTPERADPQNLKICGRGQWNQRMLVETLLSMLTGVCRFKKVAHRTWTGLRTRVAYVLALYNFLALWDGVHPDEQGFVPLSIAEVESAKYKLAPMVPRGTLLRSSSCRTDCEIWSIRSDASSF